jgi:hypothetical protein
VCDGSKDGSEIYIVGDAYCDMQAPSPGPMSCLPLVLNPTPISQGWVQGAINTAKIAYGKAFPFGPQRFDLVRAAARQYKPSAEAELTRTKSDVDMFIYY